MKELIRGKFDLPLTNWVLGQETWDILYDTVVDGRLVKERIPLHPNCYNLAKVDEICLFYIRLVPNLNNNGEWEEMAILEQKQPNQEIFDKIIKKFIQKK